ncbi:MAG: cellulose biosynthesis protein BcsS [Hyphomicrobium sp.]
MVALLVTTPGARSAEPVSAEPFWREVWIGADATSTSWLVYSGATLSPLSGIHDDGPRLRFATGYGGYSWRGRSQATDGTVARGAGTTLFADALVGYLKRLGPLTAKAFAGVSLSGHTVTELVQPLGIPVAPGEEPIDGREVGAKAAIELWLNIGARAWSSLDLNWTSAHDTYSARLRAAWRAWPTVSIGAEAIVNGDRRYDIGDFVAAPGLEYLERRGGAFARYEWFGGEVSLAGGVASAPGNDGVKPYATLNWITQF